MSEPLKSSTPPAAASRKSRKPRTYVQLTIRPVLAADETDDEVCLVIGAPGSDRLRKNLAAFRLRYPASHFRFLQD